MERHDDFPSARNQAASSQRSPNGKQNFLNNSRSVTSVGNSGRQLGSVFPRFRASIWRSCGQNACRDLLNQSAGSYWTTDASYYRVCWPGEEQRWFFSFSHDFQGRCQFSRVSWFSRFRVWISCFHIHSVAFHDFHAATRCDFHVFHAFHAFQMSCHLFGSLLSLISHVSRCFQSQLGPGDWPWLPGRASATGGDGTAVVHRRQGSPAAGRMYPARWISRNMSFHFVQTVLYYIYIFII